MKGTLIDSSVLLDLATDDPRWADWSEAQLVAASQTGLLWINPIVYSEVSIGFGRIEALEAFLSEARIEILDIPREALFLAGKVFRNYRKRGGIRTSPLPDFFIGAHAAVAKLPLLTRDVSRVDKNFPSVRILSPAA